MKLMLNGKEVSGMGHYVMAGDIKDATAEDGNVLSGKVYYNNNGKRDGTMPNRGGMSAELSAGGSVSIQEGYHNGEGVVRAQDLASQTPGTAAAANIEAGYTAWVNGEMVEGTGAMDPWTLVKAISVPTSVSTDFSYTNKNNYLKIIDKQGHINYVPISTLYQGSNYTMLRCANSSNIILAIRINFSSSSIVRIALTDSNYTLSGTIASIEEVGIS